MKTITFNNDAREKLKKGVDLITNSIKVTLGPKGRNVFFGNHYGYPISTKDGVTVARQTECRDETEQLGMLLVRQVAQKTADDAGDGTTTASLLTQAIFTEGLKVLATGSNPILIKRGIDLAVDEALEYISRSVTLKPTKDDLLRVATISANNDPVIGALIFEAITKAGDDGVITIEDNYLDNNTYIKTIEGMQLSEGYISPYFATDPNKMETVFRNPVILIADYEIDHVQPIMRAIDLALGQASSEKRPFVLIAHNVTGQALQSLVASKMKNGVPLLACKAPYFGENRTEQLTDLAILTGGRVVGPSTGLKFDEFEFNDFGECDSIVANKYSTVFSGGKGQKELIDGRIKLLQDGINNTESDYEKEKLKERLAKLTSGVAVIKVWADTEVELKEKKMRIEDALCATRAAMEEGIAPGGGIMMLKASKYLESQNKNLTSEENIGRNIVIKALQEPIKQIAINAGLEGSEIIANIVSQKPETKAWINGEEITIVNNINYGYDFLNNKYGDLLELGIIDPAKVIRLSLKNASSAAGMLLTTEVCIAEEYEDEIARTPRPRSE